MKYLCPICQVELSVFPGHRLSPNDGVTLECANHACRAQEVMGYGKNEKAAFEIILEKYKHTAEFNG